MHIGIFTLHALSNKKSQKPSKYLICAHIKQIKYKKLISLFEILPTY